jgi:ABC transport system ATP-binding/permease protein
MSVIASLHQISKSFGTQTLFKDLTFSVESGQKIGLIGPNGAGKSTLLKILAKEHTVDEGDVSFGKNLRVGYMEQSPKFNPDDTIYEAIVNASPDPYEAKYIGLTAQLISKLQLDLFDTDKKVSELSGGWQKRVALARELVGEPDLLLLDEPTNHLDLVSIQWLEDFLVRQQSMAYMLITHDRLFLQNTCDWIFDLDRKNPEGMIKVQGTYADFLDLKEALFSAQQHLQAAKKNILKRETEWLRRGAKARQTKQVARIDRAANLKTEVQNLNAKLRDRTVLFDFGDVGHMPKKIIEAVDISKTLDHRQLFKNFNFTLSGRSRVGIIGPNGCGKTTLLKILTEQLKPDTGTVKMAENVKFAYFSQKKEDLDPNISVLETICPAGDYVHVQGKPVFGRSYLGKFHFRNEQMDLPVGKLSGGEQSRLLLAQLMLQTEPILILDEPTNDLDIETLDTLEDALSSFAGAVLLVTHDRYFMDQVCTEILAFDTNNGEIVKFANVLQWQEWQKANPVIAEKYAKSDSSAESDNKKSKKKLTYKEQREYDLMEQTIHQEEALLNQMQSEMEKKEIQSQFAKLSELSTAYQKQKEKIDGLYARWEELGAKQ